MSPFRAFDATPERTLLWHLRYMQMAELTASFSKDPSTKVGAVIVRPDKTIVSMGYNGFARGCDDSPELYRDRERKYERVVHAEVNAVLSAREPLFGYTLYCYPFFTCARCAAIIIQAGLGRVVSLQHSGVIAGDRWEKSWSEARALYQECGIVTVEISDREWLKRVTAPQS